MKKKSLIRHNQIIVVIALFALLAPVFVSANGWWGSGAKSKEWILKHGGSWIPYEIEGTNVSCLYTAQMYLLGSSGAGGGANEKAKAGDLVENEAGTHATFDDAINNEYRIKIFEDGELKMSEDVTARPGEILQLTFDLASGEVKKKTKVAYSEDEIELTPDSAKYIELSELDSKKPAFVKLLDKTLVIAKDDPIFFSATDDHTGIDCYKIQLHDKGGRVLRSWVKQNLDYYFLPEGTWEEAGTIFIRAYDKAGNYVEEKAKLKITENKTADTPVEESDQQEDESEEKDENNDMPESEMEKEKRELEASLATIKNEVAPLKSEINHDLKKVDRKNFLVYLLAGPDRRIVQRVEEELEEVRKRISDLNDMEEWVVTDDMKVIIKEIRISLEEFLEDKETALKESRDSFSFWTRLTSLFA